MEKMNDESFIRCEKRKLIALSDHDDLRKEDDVISTNKKVKCAKLDQRNSNEKLSEEEFFNDMADDHTKTNKGYFKSGEDHPNAKLTNDQIHKIQHAFMEWKQKTKTLTKKALAELLCKELKLQVTPKHLAKQFFREKVKTKSSNEPSVDGENGFNLEGLQQGSRFNAKLNEVQIPLYDRLGELHHYVRLDPESIECLRNKHITYHKGWATVRWKEQGSNKTKSLGKVLLGDPPIGHKIDHIDNDKSNYHMDNLRVLSDSGNARNHAKKVNTSSKFIGVSWCKQNNRWRVCCRLNDSQIHFLGYFKEETWAAWCYNEAVRNLPGAKLNDIPKPDDYEPYQKKSSQLPDGIDFVESQQKYRARFEKLHIGMFESVEDAIKARADIVSKIVQQREEDFLRTPITYTNEKVPFLWDHKHKHKILLGEKEWHKVLKAGTLHVQYCNNLIETVHINLKNNNTNMSLARWLEQDKLQTKDPRKIDHINRNPLDNRPENRRIVEDSLSAHNRNKKRGSSSKYYGVYKEGENCWAVALYKQGKRYSRGYAWKNEVEAAKAADILAKELFGEHARLNFPVNINIK